MPTDARIAEWESRLRAGGSVRSTDPEYDLDVLLAIQRKLHGGTATAEDTKGVAADARLTAIASGSPTPSTKAAEKAIEELLKRKRRPDR